MMRKRVIVIAVVFAVAAAGAAVVVTRLATGSRSTQAPVSAAHGGSVSLGDARLTAAPGAISGSGQLVATQSGAPSAGTGNGGLAGAAAPVRFSVTGGARLVGSLLIAFRVPPSLVPARLPRSAAASAVWLSYYDPATGRWQDVVSSYDAASGTVTARVSHLSWWMPWTWDWQGIVLRLRQDLSVFGSGRAPAASCPPVSGVTLSSAGGSDPPMIGCAAKAGANALTVTLTDNRGLSEVMSGVPPDAALGPPAYDGFYQYLATSTAATALLGGRVIPPSATLAYTLPLRGAAVAFTAAPTLFSYAFDLISTVGSAVAGTAKFKGSSVGAYAQCALEAVARSRPAATADLPALAVSCIDVLASLTPDLAALVKAIGTKAFLGITLDLQLVLQTGDLFNDEVLRHVQGNVTVIRPSCDTASCQPRWSTAGRLAPGPITSVSCAGLFCAAVGATGTPGHSHGYALAYQAGTWSKPVPLGTGDSYIVSCPTATYCAAVSDTGYAYALQDGTWSYPINIYPAANIQPSSTDAIEDLSCATPSFCVAVTAMGDALTWNGTVWSPPESMGLPGIQPPLFPGNLGYVGVSCPTPVFCLAGTGVSGTGPSTAVAATWNGTGWTGTSGGPVSGPDWNASCVSATFCMVSGGYHAAGDISSIWNGTSWSGIAQPANEGAALGFNQASCPKAGLCVAADGGAHINGSSAGDRDSAIFNWSNDTWNGPELLDGKGYLDTISCSASGLCAAADSSGNIFVNPGGAMPTVRPAQADSCAVAQLSQAISAANPAVPSGWKVTKYACEAGYAIVEVYLSSAGNGYAVLKQEPSGWRSIYGLDDGTCLFGGCGGNFQLPLPAALLKELLTKAGISQ